MVRKEGEKGGREGWRGWGEIREGGGRDEEGKEKVG